MADSVEIAERERALVHDRLVGMSWEKLAIKHGIGERQARRWFQHWKERPKTDEQQDPIEYVFEELTRLEALFQGQGAIATSDDTSASERINAMKAMADLIKQMVELRQEAGLLPRNLGKLRVELDIRWMTTQIVALFDKYGLPSEAKRELVGLLRTTGPQG
jgi:hypothetical protein